MDLNKFKSGDECVFIDKSEGLGVVIYVQGNIVSADKNDVTLEVTDSGTLIGPGYMVPYDPGYIKGSVIRIIDDVDHDLLSPEQFAKLREDYEVVPQGTIQDDPEPPAPVDDKEYEEGEDPFDPRPASQRTETEDEVEEGSPDFETEGLYLTANLSSWQGIIWPKGFPQDWMEQVYKELPTGVAWERGGEPVLRMPGRKGPGLAPDMKIDLEKEFNEASKKAEEAAKKMNEAEAALEEAEKAGNKDAVAEKEKDKKDATHAFEEAKNKFLAVKKRIGEEGGWVRPPDETTYERLPGRHGPQDIASGKAGLRQAVKHLSDQYKKTLDLVDTVDDSAKRADQYQKELDLILRLRRKQLVDKSENPKDPHYVIEEGGRGVDTPRVLNLLKKLKEKELRKKPYLFSISRERDAAGNVIPSERDRVVGGAPSTALFESKVGGPISFFDLSPEEVDLLVKQEVEKSGPMDSAEVAKLAQEYAKEYKEHIQRYTEWKDLSEEIQKYLRSKHSLTVSQEQATRLDKEIFQRGNKTITAKGRDTDSGEIRELTLPVQTIFDEVVHPITENYEKRVKYLQYLQSGRKNMLAKNKGELRRLLVEEKEEGTTPIDETHYKDALISLFKNYAEREHLPPDKIPSRYRVHHGLPAAEEKNKELKDLGSQETELTGEYSQLQNVLQKAFGAFEKASEDLELFQEDMVYLKDKEPGVVSSGLLGTIEDLNQLVDQIKTLVGQREFADKFPERGDEAQVKTISEKLKETVSQLNSLRVEGGVKKYAARLVDILADLRRAATSYESAARSVSEKMFQISLTLQEIRDKKYDVAEEIK